jgi:hypothetical protein
MVRTILCAGALAAGLFCGASSPAVAAGHRTHLAHIGHVRVVRNAASGIAAQAARSAVQQGLQQDVGSPDAAPDRPVDSGKAASINPHLRVNEPQTLDDHADTPGTTPFPDRPWIEGYEPAREDALFRAAYPVLPSHNILKVFVSDTPTYGTAGIRFSARVPHTQTDISAADMQHEAATLIRTTFDGFPDVQTLDVWATIPVDKSRATTVDSTVFSISADRATYLTIRDQGLSDEAFLAAFGRVWIAPQVPR